jgi:23S rRNA pseudoU1915 N3-methylase RlmH
MTGTTTTSSSSTGSVSAGTSGHAGESEKGAEFAATMTAVLTIDVADEGEEQEGVSTEASGSETSEEIEIEIEIKTSEGDDLAENASGNETSEEIEIEIEITTFEGEALADNLSVTSNRGSTEISITTDGAIGASTDGFFFSDNPEVQMGETLTFTVPEELGNVQGGSITFSNLINNEKGFESALIIAFDALGTEVMRRLAGGNESGDVTVDIDVAFNSLDVRPVDNGSWTLRGNSDFQIKRIDVATGEGQAETSGAMQSSSSFLSDFLSFFEDRNFKLQSAVQRSYRDSTSDVFSTNGPNNAPDDRRDDELYERNRANQRRDPASSSD